MLLIHKTFGGPEELMTEYYMPVVRNSVYNSAALMSSEGSYTTLKAQFSQWARDQLENGLYETEEYTETVLDTARRIEEVRRFVRIRRDTVTNEPLRQPPPLKPYGLTVTQFTLREPWYDSTIIGLIDQKRKYRVETSVAEATAEQARQEKLTATADGLKKKTQAEYEAMTDAAKIITAARKDSTVTVTRARQELEIAMQVYEQAEAEADATIALAKGQAERRHKILAANNALEARVEAYETIWGFYKEALKHMRLSPEVAVSGAVADGIPPGYAFMQALDEQIKADLGLDLDTEIDAEP